MAAHYSEPELTYLILDFQKEPETRRAIESVRRHTLFAHKIIYLHNGANSDYAYSLFKEGLVDQFIQTRHNTGLGIGTRDLFAASFSPYSFYLQNDQYLTRDFSQEEFGRITSMIGKKLVSPHDQSAWTILSVDLAGGMWGLHGYSERGHIMPTATYKRIEADGMLGYHGAGPFHEGPWREEQIQKWYKHSRYLHYTYEQPFVADNGHRAIRENADGSLWEHRTENGALRLIRGPVRARAEHPRLTELEWENVLRTQSWPEWQIPERERTKGA